MTYSAEVMTDTPVCYWACQETSGTTLADSSGNGHNMTITGTPTLGIAGPSSGILAASWPTGLNTYAEFYQTVISANMTVEVWVKLAAYPTGPTAIFAEGDAASGASNNSDWAIQVDAQGSIHLQVVGVQDVISSPISLGVWHHVVGIVPGGQPSRLRIDKVAIGTSTANVGSGYFFKRALWIHGGGHQTAGGAAVITEAAIYQAVISDTRLNAHYDAMMGSGGGGTPPPISGVWGLVD